MNKSRFSSWTRTLLLVAFGISVAIATASSHAAELRWRSKPFQIVANDKPLADFLRELAASQGTTAVVAPKIEGTISGKFSVAGGAQNILDSICATYALTYYYDGSFLFIDPASEVVNEVISISEGSAARLTQTISRLQIADARYPLIVNEREGTAFVSGPKRYVELVRQAVRLAEDQGQAGARAEIRMFTLRYARASDYKVTRDGKEVVVLGVSSILRNLFGKNSGSAAGRDNPFPVVKLGSTRQVKLSSGDTANVPKIDGLGMVRDEDRVTSKSGPTDLPQFQADTGLNAILVRDAPDRMEQYEKIIASLDIRPRLIEIEVTIMDISSDRLTSLGIDWRAHGSHADLQFGRGDAPPLTFATATTEAGQTGPSTPAGVVLTGSIGNSLRDFLLARVTALSQTGQANFIARPKVTTLDNNEAVVQNMNEFFVRVGGFQDAGLFNVKAGTSVRVTPLIIDEEAGRGVMLTIDIADESVGPALADNIPSIRRRSVNTKAIVEEGKSLLIAGYSSEEMSNSTTGIPGLSSIPIIGNLFKSNQRTQGNMERFYLLTPRLVVAGTATPVPRGAISEGQPAVGTMP